MGDCNSPVTRDAYRSEAEESEEIASESADAGSADDALDLADFIDPAPKHSNQWGFTEDTTKLAAARGEFGVKTDGECTSKTPANVRAHCFRETLPDWHSRCKKLEADHPPPDIDGLLGESPPMKRS